MSHLTAPAPAPAMPVLGTSPTLAQMRPASTEPLAEFGRALREEFGREFDRFCTLQRDATDELLLFGLGHPEMREEMLAVLEHELTSAATTVRRARRFGRESEVALDD